MGPERSRTSTKPSGSTRATLTCSPSTRFHTIASVVSPKRCGSLIKFSISHRTTWILLRSKAAIAQAEGDLPRASALLAPLHPRRRRIRALEIQVYQAILERRPATDHPSVKRNTSQA